VGAWGSLWSMVSVGGRRPWVQYFTLPPIVQSDLSDSDRTDRTDLHGTHHRKFRARDPTTIQSLCESLAMWATVMPGKCFESDGT
jgi:hypothetical protein